MPTERQLRAELCEIGKRVWQRGLVAGFDGNFSARVAADRILCTPTGVSKGFMKPAAICLLDLAGKPIGNTGKATSEILLHLQIYAARPDVSAIVHAHPPCATAWACSGMMLPEGIYPEADLMLGRVASVAYSTPGYRELGASVIKAITPETNSVILGGHGTVHMGRTVEEAWCYLEVLEAYCGILLKLGELGQVNLPSRKQMRALLALKNAKGIADSRIDDLASIDMRRDIFVKYLRKRRK
jgi:L-fuculose-phosphate aldolase